MKGFKSLASQLLCCSSILFSSISAVALKERPGNTSSLVKRIDLAAEWEAVHTNKALQHHIVEAGASGAWKLKMGESQSFITSPLYGCSVAVFMGPNGVVIGHLRQDAGPEEGSLPLHDGHRERCVTIENARKTREFIDKMLENKESGVMSKVELTESCDPDDLHGYILSGSTQGHPAGEKVLKDYMQSQFIPKEHITTANYLGSGGGDDKAPPGTSQKFLVRWTSPDAALGGILEVYYNSNTPRVKIRYNPTGGPAHKRGLGNAMGTSKTGKTGKACRLRSQLSKSLKPAIPSLAATSKSVSIIPATKIKPTAAINSTPVSKKLPPVAKSTNQAAPKKTATPPKTAKGGKGH